jgi:Transposase DDE domain group 1
VSIILRLWIDRCKRRIQQRLNPRDKGGNGSRPMFTARNIHYEASERVRAIAHGGIGALHAVAQRLELAETIDQDLHLLIFHQPYHESDHVLNIAYIPLCDGTCFQDIELRRNDENYLDALGAYRIPDPTTAGDFCRRFGRQDIYTLLDSINKVRLKAWAFQPASFFERAVIDMDGTLVPTTGACKQDMDIAYDGTWGYHPLILSLANTAEVLGLVNRSGNRPSHEGAAAEVNRALAVCFRGGFRSVLLRGDTDFSQTEYLDGWDADPRVRFVFGYDAIPKLKVLADSLPEQAWERLHRPGRSEPRTGPRQRPANVKEAIIVAREYENLRLQSEDVAEFNYKPTACRKTYRMVVVRKNISRMKGEKCLFDEVRYFFYITNDWVSEAYEIVFAANDRCNQENLLAQLHNGVKALKAPSNTLESNWAYMVMTALAWNLKAWWALLLPEDPGRDRKKHAEEKKVVLGMEFKRFVNAFVRIPCQIIRTARKLVYRFLGWNPNLGIMNRLLEVLHC